MFVEVELPFLFVERFVLMKYSNAL